MELQVLLSFPAISWYKVRLEHGSVRAVTGLSSMGRQTQLLHNRSLIPRPGYVVIKRESLMKCMGLKEKDRTRFEQAKFLLRKLCPKYLKVGRSYSEQTDTNWRKFCEAACEAEPMFRRYVDYWPITHYIQGYLYALKARQRERRNRRASSSEDDDEEDEEYEAESTGFCEPVKGLAASQHKVVGDRTLPKSATHILQRMFDFRAVLKEADPILGTHYERLASAGINDKQSLEAFCDFPKREKESFLADHCGLTIPLDLVRVRLALEQAQRQCNMLSAN